MKHNIEEILLFKTNIASPADKHVLKTAFDLHPHIRHWSIDLDDTDHVLRVVSPVLSHETIIDMVTKHGYNCEELKETNY